MKCVVDTNIINRLIDGHIRDEDLPSDCEFIATHVQVDELIKTKDKERRARLLIRFSTLITELPPTESVIAGISRVGHCRVSDGILYESLKTALDKKNSGKRNNAEDVLIAEVAVKNGYTLVTADRALAAVAKQHGCKVRDFAFCL